MFDGFVSTVLQFIHQYGFVAIFVYMVLETSFLLHYVPSEVVVPFAAEELVHDPLTFILFVADTTAGATVGSILAYIVFGQYGRGILERYGHIIHVSNERLDWSEDVFIRYGESSVFWGRMLPFLRAFISIPAGLAEMEFRRFVVYSTAGALLFNSGLTYLVYAGGGRISPLELVINQIQPVVTQQIVYTRAHPRVVFVLIGVIVLLGAAGWVARDWIRAHPQLATELTLHGVRIVGILIGGLFVLGALSSPDRAFAAITSIWNDPIFWVRLGFSKQIALLFVGIGIALVGMLLYELGQVVKMSNLQSVLQHALSKLRKL